MRAFSLLLLLVLVACSPCPRVIADEPIASPFRPFAFLVGHTWEGTFPDGKTKGLTFRSFPAWRYSSEDQQWEIGSINYSIMDTFWSRK